MSTIGDEHFESFCSSHGIGYTRIPEGMWKTPDYLVHLGSYRLLAEVKTLEPNAEEQEVNARRARGEIVAGGGTPGERLRRELRHANAQLKRLATAEHLPGMLVVFNNTGCRIHTDPYSVMTAMQGLDVIDVSVPRDRAESPTFGPTHSGPERAMRTDANTSTSAIAILQVPEPGEQFLNVFHNRHARVPIDPAMLRISGIRHFRLPTSVTSSLGAPWYEV